MDLENENIIVPTLEEVQYSFSVIMYTVGIEMLLELKDWRVRFIVMWKSYMYYCIILCAMSSVK